MYERLLCSLCWKVPLSVPVYCAERCVTGHSILLCWTMLRLPIYSVEGCTNGCSILLRWVLTGDRFTWFCWKVFCDCPFYFVERCTNVHFTLLNHVQTPYFTLLKGVLIVVPFYCKSTGDCSIFTLRCSVTVHFTLLKGYNYFPFYSVKWWIEGSSILLCWKVYLYIYTLFLFYHWNVYQDSILLWEVC